MDQVKFVEDRHPLKNLKGYGLLKQTSQILLSPILKTLSRMISSYKSLVGQAKTYQN